MPTLILTQNNNVAIMIGQMENQYIPDPQVQSWIPRQIACLSKWIPTLTASLLKSEAFQGWTLLNSEQELALWRSIISAWQKKWSRDDFYVRFSEEERQQIELLNIEATTRTAQTIWRRLRLNELLETPYIPTLDNTNIALGTERWYKSLKETAAKYPSDNQDALFQIGQLNQRCDNSNDSRMTPEFNNYLDWQQEFQKRCRSNKWLDHDILPTLLTVALKKGSLDQHALKYLQETDLIAYAFLGVPESHNPQEINQQPSFPPQTITLFQALQQRVKSLSFISDASHLFPQQFAKTKCHFTCHIAPASATVNTHGQLLENSALPTSVYATIEQEFHDIAQQIAAILQGREASDMPSIGVIVPQLEAYREQIIAAFDNVLCPQLLLPEHCQDERPYTISLGRKLNEEPMVRTIFDFFKLLYSEQKGRLLTSLINSPYLCRPTDATRCYCAALDRELRQSGKIYFSFQDLVNANPVQQSSSEEEDNFALFCSGLKAVATRLAREDLSAPKTYAAWSDFWLGIIQDMHWPLAWQQLPSNADNQAPIAFTMPAAEVRSKRAFLQLLQHMKSMGDVAAEKVSYPEALILLGDLAAAKISQPPATYKAPVHISGILEAVGLRYDYVFVINYTDQVWPSLSSSLPFLPMQLQRALNMPSPQSDLDQARWVNERLAHLAPQGTISFANNEIDGNNPRALNICRLLTSAGSKLDCHFDTTYKPHPYLSWSAQLARASFASEEAVRPINVHNKYLEHYANAAPLPSPQLGRSQNLPGGSSMLQRQLDCPFRALAAYRWGIVADEAPSESPNVLHKGTTIHNIMERLWKKWRTYSGFAHVQQSGDLRQDIESAVSEVLEEQRAQRPDFGTTYFELEQKRLTRALYNWFTQQEIELQTEIKSYANTNNIAVSCESQRAVELPFTPREDGQRFKLSLRLDRLDQTVSRPQRYYLSDYKTSKNYNIKKWLADADTPPCDVQLPLYAVALLEGHPDYNSLLGLGYANIVAKGYNTEHALQVVMNSQLPRSSAAEAAEQSTLAIPQTAPKKKKNKEPNLSIVDMLPEWRVWVDRAANNIINAHHPVFPRRDKDKDACQYCTFLALCHRDEEPLEDSAANHTINTAATLEP